jgi:amino acid transporter
MGRDGVIPKNIFAHLNKKHACPDYNVLIIGILACIGAFLLNYAECAQLINFGAFLAFMGVNVASVNEHFFKSTKKSFKTFFIYYLRCLAFYFAC